MWKDIIERLNNSKFRFLIPPMIVLILINIIFIINGVYPFGSNTLTNGDLGKAYLPIYYYMYDLFNGDGSLFINYKVGMGTDMYDLISIYGIFSPISWLLTLTSRSDIPNFMSYLFMIKVSLISVTSFLLFDRIYKKIDLVWKTLFSVFYALGGFVIVYHTNFVWLDNVILFPLLLLGFKKIIDKGDYKFYTLILFLSIIFSYYITYMELLFILFLSFGYLHFLCEEEKKKKFIYNLGLGTFFAIGLSFGFVFPTLIQTFNSVRMLISLNDSSIISALPEKLLSVLFYALPIILLFIMFFSKKVNRKVKNFLIYISIIMLIGVLFNPINLMWHSGSYVAFPYRYGFISIIIIYLGSLYYLKFNPKLQFKVTKNYYIYITFLVCLLIYFFSKYIPLSAANDPSLFLSSVKLIFYVLVLLILSIVLVIVILLLDNLLVKRILLVIFLFFSCIGWSLGYVGISSSELKNETTDYSFKVGNNLFEFLNKEINDSVRYKNLDVNMIMNYGFIINKATISNWHMVDLSSFNTLNKMGYLSDFTGITDVGGTLFTDNLLGINRYITSKKLDERVYELVDSFDNINLYKLKNSLGNGILYNNIESDDSKIKNSFDYQNLIYRKLFDKDDDILEKANYAMDSESGSLYSGNSVGEICVNKDTELIFYLAIDELSELYFNYNLSKYIEIGLLDDDLNINFIKVNDEILYNPTVNDRYNQKFFSDSGNVDLGLFENEKVKVTISVDKDICLDNAVFSKISINKLNNLVDEYKSDVDISYDKNKLIVSVESNGKESLFLPFNYLNGYNCKVNGKIVEVKKGLDNFIVVPLEADSNKIILTYYPPYFKMGCIVSFVSLILFLIFKKFKFVPNNFVLNIFKYCYYLILIIMFFYVYIYGFFR